MIKRTRWRLSVLAILLAVLGGCAPSHHSTLPPPPASVTVGMHEYAFDYDHPVPAGRVIFRVSNGGVLEHQPILARVPDTVTGSLEDQLRGTERRGARAVITLPPVGKGERAVFAADLQPGRYAFFCFVVDADGLTHALKGMAKDFTVA